MWSAVYEFGPDAALRNSSKKFYGDLENGQSEKN